MPNFQLNFPMQQQKETEWCWAAVAVSVAAFYQGVSPPQCDVVNKILK